ncbi:MAG: hypothetical protein IJU98_06995, partial [Synergistaceae bacterium]|nr:hypothetical protein [Synergistaceae bacterium]
MSLVITNNILALSAHNDMAAIHKNLAKAIEKTATGMQINSAGDDAAGLAVSEKMRAQTQGLDRAASNTQDGISLIQTAEGALSETHSILQRMRELALQAANDTLTADDRSYIQLEAGELKDKIDYIAETTQFNGKKLLNGDAAALWSSDKMETRALIRGGLQEADSYVQKSSFEGNYNIDIQATAGQAQVQKSQIITPPLREEEVPHDIFINSGLDSVRKSRGKGWKFEDGVLTISGNGTYRLVGDTSDVTSNRVVVEEGVEATIFLKDMNIDVSGDPALSAFEITGANVDLYLEGDNTLISGMNRAGLEVQNVEGGHAASLTISSEAGDGSTEGKLTAISKDGYGAGIGGPVADTAYLKGSVGKITINGGTIFAQSEGFGAGIGGGDGYSDLGGSGPNAEVDVTINGGDITAIGGS